MDMTIREKIYDMLHEIRSQSPHHKLKAVYLGHENYRDFLDDPEVFRLLPMRQQSEMIFAGVEILRVDKPNHIGFGWTDGRIDP